VVKYSRRQPDQVIDGEPAVAIVGLVTPAQILAAATRRTDDLFRDLGEDIKRLREDAGVSQRALSRATGIDQAEISRIEAGRVRPTVETCERLSVGLGADLSMRLFPNAGPAIRDRHQARIVEALVAGLDRRWRAWPEVGVRQPVRGWIDVVLADPGSASLIATEIVSSIRRLEQLLRWSGAKAEAIASSEPWPFGITGNPQLSRLMIVRATAANVALITAFRATTDAAYPASPWQAFDALTGGAPWPGSSLLWAADRKGGAIEITAVARARIAKGSTARARIARAV
jgi:transcriptional regulator with XRE-family HTH domain